MIKNSCLKGVNIVVYLDDTSRCVTGFGLFSEATSENAILTLRHAIRRFGKPAQILSNHGTQFTSNHPSSKKKRTKYTTYEQGLMDLDITQLLTRVNHPQTNGKIERFFRTLETGVDHFGSVPDFIKYYNEERLHFSLNMESGETPRVAFRRKRASTAIRKKCPKWMGGCFVKCILLSE